MSKEFVRDCMAIVLPSLVLSTVVVALLLTDHKEMAITITLYGVPATLAVAILYITGFNSREIWPHLSWWQRLGKIFFRR